MMRGMASVRQEPVAGELVLGLGEREVRRRDDEVGFAQVVAVDGLPLRADELQEG